VTSTPTSYADPPTSPAAVPRAALLTKAVAFFSGPVGIVTKYVLLAVANAVGLYSFTVLLADGRWIVAAFVVLATVATDVVYLVPRAQVVPLKFLLPGTILLILFQITPIVYNATIAFSNYSTGHVQTKEEAIQTIKESSLAPPANGRAYTMTPAEQDGSLVLLLRDDASGKVYVGSEDGLDELPAGDVTVTNGTVTAAKGYDVLAGDELAGIDQQLTQLVVPAGEDRFIRAEGLSTAVELVPALRYDEATDTFTSVETDAVFHDNGRGAYATDSGETLEQGWRVGVGFANFKKIFTDPLVRDPFISVFLWTFAYAGLSVLFTFAFGLFLAIVLNKSGLRLRRTQRALLVIPYAIPAFLAVFVWGGMLNDDFGLINNGLHIDIPWLFDANWAKVSCLLVNFWLGFPYFFLVCTGALQAIPEELNEAARVDGAGGVQIFRKVTFPLLMVAVAPLLIASFAFNFNNFNNIYFLTRGGPYGEDQVVAGSTDILISYTYKLAFQAAGGADYGLAAAVSIIIFFIIAMISAVSFSRTKALENLA
jgi:arabinogalactan oligomer/maltooligosaccharide transport system permease protein